MQWFQSPRGEAADWPGDCGLPVEQFVTAAAQFESESEPVLFNNLANRITKSVLVNYARMATKLRLARVALALMAAQQKTGEWPDALPGPPVVDPYSGEPFVYERDDKEVRLYSSYMKQFERNVWEIFELYWIWPK